MTTCSSSSDDPDSTSTSDVEEYVDKSTTDNVSLGHIHESDGLGSKSLSKLKTDVKCHADDDNSYNTDLCKSGQRIIATKTGCNGIVAEVDAKSEAMCTTSSNLPEVSHSKSCDRVVTSLANGLVSDISVLSSVNCVTLSQVQLASVADENDESDCSARVHTHMSEPPSDACCTSHAVNNEVKISLTNSIPLLSIPQIDHSCADSNVFSILPSLSSQTAEDTTVQVMPPSVFSVPSTSNESNSFTEVNLDDDEELRGAEKTLCVPPAVSAKSSGESSPGRLLLASSSSSVQLDDAIVQSVLCDDDNDDTDSSRHGSSRHSAAVAFSTNTDSAAFRTPACAATDAVPNNEDGLHVVEPDTASFEEISLHSCSGFESRSGSIDHAAVPNSKISGLANFFAR